MSHACNATIVSPSIEDSLSSSDVIVREGSNVTLRCRASGSPTPVVKWKRDSMEKIAINKSLVGEYIWVTEKEYNLKNVTIGNSWVFFLLLLQFTAVASRSSVIINLFLFCFSKHLIGTLFYIPICWNVRAFISLLKIARHSFAFLLNNIHMHWREKRVKTHKEWPNNAYSTFCCVKLCCIQHFFSSTRWTPSTSDKKKLICKHDTITRRQQKTPTEWKKQQHTNF